MSLLEDIINNEPKIVCEEHDRKKGKHPSADCHNLATGTNGRIAVVVAQKPAWHCLGTFVDRCLSGAEALRLGAIDYTVEKVEAKIQFGDKTISDTGFYGIVRTDTGELLNTGRAVGGRYTEFQNAELADMLDEIIEGGAEIETAGALGNGSTVWFLAKMPEYAEPVDGDVLESYIMGTTTHDGTGSIRFLPTSCRVVCQNTHRIAIGEHKTKGIAFRHTKNANIRAKQAQEALNLSRKRFELFSEQAEQLAKVSLVTAGVDEEGLFQRIMDAQFGEKKIANVPFIQENIDSGKIETTIDRILNTGEREKAEKQYRRAIKERRSLLDDILERHNSETCEAAHGTLWSAYNAVSETADHGEVRNFYGDEKTRLEKRMTETTLGVLDDFKQNAWNVCNTYSNMAVLA